MNQTSMISFFDELTKIADFRLTGPEAIWDANGIRDGVTAGPSTEAFIKQRMTEHQANLKADVLREAKMERMLRRGQWNPETHTVDLKGNLIPKTAPASNFRNQATNILTPKELQAGGEAGMNATKGTSQIINKGVGKPAIRGASKLLSSAAKFGRRLGKGRMGILGLGLGLGGLGGAAGTYAAN